MNEKDILNEGVAIATEGGFPMGAKVGLAVLIGSGLTAAAIVGGRKLKKVLADRKTGGETDEVIIDADFEEADIHSEDMAV